MSITIGIPRKGGAQPGQPIMDDGGSGGDAMMMQMRQRDDRVWNERMM